MLSLAGCGGDAAKPSGKDVSISAVTKGTADQACADLFGKASGIGAKFGENEFTWVRDSAMTEPTCTAPLTPVGGKGGRRASFKSRCQGRQLPTRAPTSCLASGSSTCTDGGEGEWSDTQKKAVQDLIEAAAPHVKD
jgi:hypothetical protein